MNRAPTWQRLLVTVACVYEAVALWSDQERLPTITTLVHRRPWLSAPLVGAMSYHFHPDPQV